MLEKILHLAKLVVRLTVNCTSYRTGASGPTFGRSVGGATAALVLPSCLPELTGIQKGAALSRPWLVVSSAPRVPPLPRRATRRVHPEELRITL